MESIRELGLPTIELEGNRSIVITGRCVITRYSADEMRVRCGRLTVCVSGDELELRSLDAGEIAIGGVIVSVGFELEGCG